ncbi:GNAT family N-acetyltransferase [Calidifontibacter sp. DB0510]|uniref:GNAT family N-acetyltransferase n=1 Tax=Metallococcus carri TaxID=1656884 RepID=A0A967AXF4_9MICO|nr:GNAT family N-acetyltransferase [Metallococcus carri]NHN54204.1 GNAT family N-acetyltransferase [Metallococcus carri]NOP36956.1 GNAT family N-acetyltransferase [Calidifontibacter sp. DB2511S]
MADLMDFRVRDVTRDDIDRILQVRTRSFGPGSSEGAWFEHSIQQTIDGRWLAVVDPDNQLVASARAWGFQQVWGGRHLPMGGVAGVVVDPRVRGRGVASLMMRALLTRMHELGDVVSCLYASVPALYRVVGYEAGGGLPRMTLSTNDFHRLPRADGTIREATVDDADVIERLVREHQARLRQSGPKAPPAATWAVQLADPEMAHYLAVENGRPVGVVAYGLKDGVLTVETVAGRDGRVLADLWAVVGSGSSTAETIEAYVDPRDPILLRVGSNPATDRKDWQWMARVVDLPNAVAARGFSAYVNATATITVTDDDLAHNTGDWRISIADGAGVVERSDQPGLRVGARGLAALWCGWSVQRLRDAGLAEGDADEAALDAIFACAPFMSEYF